MTYLERYRKLKTINEIMKTNIIFFEDAKDLESLTGLSYDAKKVELSHEYEDEPFDFDDFC